MKNVEKIPCKFCGEDIIKTAKKCKHCGEFLDETMKKDIQQPMINIVNQQNQNAGINNLFPEKNWVTALLLSIFLGWGGFDRFYLGHGGLGILKLLTLGGFGLWWVIDIILIATKSVGGVIWK